MNNTTNENMGYTTPTTNQKPVFPTLHKSWKIVLEDNFEPHRFQSFLKDIFLQDDSMHGLRHFYNKIRHAMHTSFKKHVDVLPPFGKIGTVSNIRNLQEPENPNYIGYTTIQSVYEWFGNAISNLLFDTNVINQKRIPRAYRIIITHSSTDDGWNLLFNLL